mgnify:CR=1 FL=1
MHDIWCKTLVVGVGKTKPSVSSSDMQIHFMVGTINYSLNKGA